jgi:hypothetical protein
LLVSNNTVLPLTARNDDAVTLPCGDKINPLDEICKLPLLPLINVELFPKKNLFVRTSISESAVEYLK